jgi:hypothetical protein
VHVAAQKLMNNTTFHAGSKLAWIEQIAIDRNLTDFELRVAVAISRRIGGNGEAIVSQETIANTIGATARGVRKATTSLADHGHLEMDRSGVGRGIATRYRPIIKRRNSFSRKGDSDRDNTRNGDTLNSETEKQEQRSTLPGTTVPPEIPYIDSIKNPGARASARHLPQSSNALQRRWWAIKGRLAQSDRMGEDKVEAWLNDVHVAQVENCVVELITPGRFKAKEIMKHFYDLIIGEWRAADPSIQELTIKVCAPHVENSSSIIDQKVAEAESPVQLRIGNE